MGQPHGFDSTNTDPQLAHHHGETGHSDRYMTAPASDRRNLPSLRFRGHIWTPVERAILVALVATVMGSLFIVTYSLALSDPVPHRIDAALVGDQVGHDNAVEALQRVAGDKIAFSRYPTVAAALRAIDLQQVYAVLDLSSSTPILYVASAAGASVARVLGQAAVIDSNLRVLDAHPLSEHDPSGVEIFYLVFVTTIIGFFTIFQARANAPLPKQRPRIIFVLGLSTATSLALTLVDGPLLDRVSLPVAEVWGILALQLLVAASFAEVTSFLIGRWAVVPTWLFFVVLGNTSSGGTVAAPLLPQPFAFLSEWLPTGVAETAIRDAVYFHSYQHARPVLILAAWAAVLFSAWLLSMRRIEARRGSLLQPNGGGSHLDRPS